MLDKDTRNKLKQEYEKSGSDVGKTPYLKPCPYCHRMILSFLPKHLGYYDMIELFKTCDELEKCIRWD